MKLDLLETAFDVDGVVMDVVTPFLRLLEKRGYGGFTAEDITDFNLAAVLKVPEAVVDEIVADLLERPVMVQTKPYPGAAEILESLCRRHPLLFVTARHRIKPTQELFLSALPELPADRYEIVATGDPYGKLDCLKERGRRFFIDDHLGTCRQLKAAGLEPLVFDRPWNRCDGLLPRVRSWAELGSMFDSD
ncbi:MAG: hypothetical protein AB1641_30580 [Thermodesulfobacteriota bacterium]